MIWVSTGSNSTVGRLGGGGKERVMRRVGLVNFHPVSCATLQQGDRSPKLSQSSIHFFTVPGSSQVTSKCPNKVTTRVFRECVLEFPLFNSVTLDSFETIAGPFITVTRASAF